MSDKNLIWEKNSTPEELHLMLSTLEDEYPIRNSGQGRKVAFEKLSDKGKLKVSPGPEKVIIEYNSINCALRGVGIALAEISVDENIVFDTLGIMLDCSRNAVMTVEHMKKWLRRLALMGYNMAMLYTEDTYQLPDEPYFGYMRGPYTLEEIKEIDDYAFKLGIEIIPCIQTLGHLEQILRWAEYDKVRDTSRVMMVDEEDTYKLINKMLEFWGEGVRSRRMHLGMDETHDLGRGKFMDKFGYERGFDMFNRHLAKVKSMCEKHGLEPMIWSDMYFRMSNEDYSYYDESSVIPEDVKQAIPEGVELVYWDYYHTDKKFYNEWIKRHRELGSEPLMGSGVWTWTRAWYDHVLTEKTVRPCLEACRESNLKEIFFTLWGDDGAYCEFDSALAGLYWSAEVSFGGDENCGKMEKVFNAVCGGSYKEHIAVSCLEDYENNYRAMNIVWDDLLMGKWYREVAKTGKDKPERLLNRYRSVLNDIESCSFSGEAGDMNYAITLAKTMVSKLETQINLYDAYLSKDTAALGKLKDKQIPVVIENYRSLTASFREQWMRKNKPFGLEFIQVRLAGQIARLEEAATRIAEFLDGKEDFIPELEAIELTAPLNIHGGYSTYAFSCVNRW